MTSRSARILLLLLPLAGPRRSQEPLDLAPASELLAPAPAPGGADAELLARVASRLAPPGLPRPRFSLLEDPAGLWLLPSGRGVLSPSLLPLARHEAGLAYLLAHSLAHLELGHLDARVRRQLGFLGGEAALSRPAELDEGRRRVLAAALGLLPPGGPALPFSEADERAADSRALELLEAAGYPPGVALEVRERAARLPPSSPWVNLHPAGPATLAALRRALRDRPGASTAASTSPRWFPSLDSPGSARYPPPPGLPDGPAD